jgi:hypothetical protein
MQVKSVKNGKKRRRASAHTSGDIPLRDKKDPPV